MSGYFVIKIFFCLIQHVRNKGLDSGACQYLQTKATVQDPLNKARLTCENIHAFRVKTHAYRVKNTHFRANRLNMQRVVFCFRQK